MIRFLCHPSIHNLLTTVGDRILDVVFISDFLPQHQNNLHSGLTEAAKYRLQYPSYHIIFLSFQAKEEFVAHDKFNILSLLGTKYMRLPVEMQELYEILDKFVNVELVIPKQELEQFSVNTATTLLKEKLSLLKHGNTHDFINEITAPLRANCLMAKRDTRLLMVIKEQLVQLHTYISEPEITELFQLIKAVPATENKFFADISGFVTILNELAGYAEYEVIEPKTLIILIDELNNAFSLISKP